MVHDTLITSEEDLVVQLSAAAGNVRGMLDVFPNVRQSMRHRCESCIAVGGRPFEQLL